MTVALERGDLAPDFMLPNLAGKLARFYDRFAGNAVVLHFCRSHAGVEAEAKLRGFAEQRDQFDALAGRVVVVTQDSHEANAGFVSGLGLDLDLDLFSDPVGAITNGYCGEPAGKNPGDGNYCTTFVVDPNQRMAAAFHGGTGHAQRALDGLADLRRRLAPGADPRPAPILVLPDVLDPDNCQKLIAEWECEHYEGVITVGTGFQDEADSLVLAESVKKRRDHRLADDINARISDVIGRRVVPMMQKAFHFRVGSIQHFRIVAYSAERGDFSRPIGTMTLPRRKTAASPCR